MDTFGPDDNEAVFEHYLVSHEQAVVNGTALDANPESAGKLDLRS